MRLAAHYMFSFGMGMLIFGASVPGALLAIVEAYLVNRIIDVVGHGTEGGRPARSPRTHSVPGALAVGLPVGVVIAVILTLWGSPALVRESLQARMTTAAILDGVGVSLGHLFMDSLTEGGIFVNGHRWALAHWRYDGPANAAFILLGILMAAAAVMV